jgi:hypothetical protein
MGYNVITSAYINPNDAIKHRNYPVLDQEKMFQDGIITKSSAYQESFETVAGNNIKEVIKARSINIGVDVDVAFTGGISGSFENIQNETMSENILFAKLNYYRYTEDHKINGATSQNLSEYITTTFINDLQTKTATQILDLYGTHIFVQYFKGGSLEANYTYTGSDLKTNEAVRMAAGATFKAIPGVNVSGDVSASSNTSEFEKAENLAFKYQAFGGNAIAATSLSALKTGFSGWANSISGKAEICGIAAYNSLIPIWDLANVAGYSIKANELKNKFEEIVSQKGLALPLARKYKTESFRSNEVSMTPSYYLKPPVGGTIAEVEIYILGAGGGGQGGNNNTDPIYGDNGTGGAGGGGAAIYAKLGKLGLNKGDQIPLSITIGAGGTGGNYIQLQTGLLDSYINTAGCNGEGGGNTTVTWGAKNMTFTANGGNGGNGNSTCVKGGGTGTNGGSIRAANCPATNSYIEDCVVGNGGAGSSGNVSNPNLKSAGGNAGRITKGSINPFGGCSGSAGSIGSDCYSGGERQANTNTVRQADFGSGGVGENVYGGYVYGGYRGGDGLVSIVIKSFTEE